MSITAAQRADRTLGIGSSDAAAILGMNPWKRAADVLLEKRGVVEPADAGELAELGTMMEPSIANLAAKKLGVLLVPPDFTWVAANGIMRANPDRFIEKEEVGRSIVEIKDTGQLDGWGLPGTDQVPEYVLIQVVHQMICVQAPEAHVAVLKYAFGRRWMDLYKIKWDDVRGLAEEMEQRLCAWWDKHMVKGEPIDMSVALPPTMDTLTRIKRTAKKIVTVPANIVRMCQNTRAEEKTAEAERKLADEKLIASMGDAEAFESDIGAGTYFEQTRGGVDQAKLKAEYPEVWAKVSKPTTFRVLRIPGAKAGGGE